MLNLENLNDSQKQAISALEGPVLCIAGAGSGKTTTLTYRVANLIAHNVNPASILLLTFTKKAATEMLSRVITLVGQSGRLVEGGTFHHFAAQIIGKYGEAVGVKRNFVVIDDNDSADVVQSLKHSINSKLQGYSLPSSRNMLYQIISRARNCEKPIKSIVELYYPHIKADSEGLEILNEEYKNYKETNNLLDYDDLLEKLYEILRINEYKTLLASQYKYIMVDEYQDTNAIQARITLLLSQLHKNIMVVGDDAQSIYSFRGSRVDNILEFSSYYKNCQIIKLEQNYRSYGYILDACNSLINNSKKCIKKKLFSNKPKGNKIALVKCISEKEEAALIVSQIFKLYKAGYPLNDMAVLFRNSNHSYELELELAKRAVPFKKVGGPQIFDSDHIRDLISYLRVLNNPYDNFSWIRILMLVDGIGIQTATGIFEQIKTQIEPFDLSNIKAKKEVKANLLKLSNMLLNSIKYLNSSPANILNFITDYYFPILKAKYQDSFANKVKELDQISVIAAKYPSLQALLSEMFLDKSEESSNEKKMFLTLSTIHSAKGLEWKQVFILSALEGRFPTSSSVKSLDSLEEERRLMYVAMTRAKEGLMISYPSGIWDKFSREFLSKPSRFLAEIATSNLEILEIKR